MIAYPVVCGPVEIVFRKASFDTLRRYGFHNAIDIYAPEGTEIRSPSPGTVTSRTLTNTERGGFQVSFTGSDGETHFFSHMLGPADVEPGDRIGAGVLLGRVGKSGNAPTPHVHYQVKTRDGVPYNPYRALVHQLGGPTPPYEWRGPVECGGKGSVLVAETDLPLPDEVRREAVRLYLTRHQEEGHNPDVPDNGVLVKLIASVVLAKYGLGVF